MILNLPLKKGKEKMSPKLFYNIFLLLGFLVTPSIIEGAATSKGGKIIYAEMILPDTYNPLTSTDNETSLRICELLFESLVYIDHRGDVKGRLAEKWKIFNGNKRIVFTLRKNIKWHDGQPFTAEDVKFTYEAIVNPLSDIPRERRKALEVIKSVKVMSNNVIKFDFKSSVPEPEKRFLFKLLPKHIFKKTVISKLAKFAKKPIGTGYYQFIRETKKQRRYPQSL